MLHLRTFGLVALYRRPAASAPIESAPVIAPRRALGLLAFLAASDPAGVSRDTVAALLWPDSDDEAARNSLRQTLFQLKQATDVRCVIGVADLALDPTVLDSDVRAFQRAFDNKDYRTAVALYRGPFLDGYFRRGNGEFERWTDDRRAELARKYTQALRAVADLDAAAGNAASELEHRRRLCAIDPGDAALAMAYMNTLAKLGERRAAIAHYATYERLLQVEYGVAPPAQMVALANSLRHAPAEASPVVVAAAPEAGPTTSHVVNTPSMNRPSWRWRIGATTSLAVVVVLAALFLVRVATPEQQATASDSTYVEVRASGEDAQRTVAPLASMLGARLADIDGLLVSTDSGPAWARQRVVVSVESHARSDSIRLVVTPSGLRSDDATAIEILGLARDIGAILDRAALQLIPALVRPHLHVAVSRARQSTSSLEALKLFIAAETNVHSALYPAAMQLLLAAVDADSQFAYGFHRLAEVADWNGREDEMLNASARASALADALPEDDRQLISSVAAWRFGDVDRAERGLRELVTDYPGDLEGWYFLGEVQFHSAPMRGRDFTRAADAFERVMRAGTRRRDVTIHLSRIAMKRGDRAAAESITWRGISDSLRLADHDKQPYLLMDTTAAALQRLEQRLRDSNSESFLWEVIDRGALYSENVSGAAHLARLLSSPPWSIETRRAALIHRAVLHAAAGQFRTADSILLHGPLAADDRFVLVRVALALAPYSTLPSATLYEIHSRALRWTPPRDQFGDRAAHLNALTARYRDVLVDALGRQIGAASRPRPAAALRSEHADLAALDRALGGWLWARSAAARGDSAEALQTLIDTAPQVTLGSVKSILGSFAAHRWLRAELLEAAGQLVEAHDWYDALVSTSALETPFLAPAHLRSARIAERLGNVADAARHYRAVQIIWRDGDAELGPLVRFARLQTAELRARGMQCPSGSCDNVAMRLRPERTSARYPMAARNR